MHVGGGLRAQLLCLRASIHPVTKEKLPQATWLDGSPIVGTGMYLRLQAAGKEAKPEGFVEYEPMELRTTKPEGGKKPLKRGDVCIHGFGPRSGREHGGCESRMRRLKLQNCMRIFSGKRWKPATMSVVVAGGTSWRQKNFG